MISAQNNSKSKIWRPITFDLLLSDYSLFDKRIVGILLVWLFVIIGTLSATIWLLPQEWVSLETTRANVTNFFLFNPALILGFVLFFWLGFEWGFIPIFLCSFVIAFHSNMPWGWALVFGISFVFGLSISAMAYQGFRIPYDLRSLKSIVFYVSIMFIASIGSSLGAFIWSYTHQLSAYDTLMIWKGWWSGSFLQAIFITGPIIWTFTPIVEDIKKRWFNISGTEKVSLKWVLGAVTSITCALALFIFSGKLLGKLRVQEVMTDQTATSVVEVINALESFEIISWISIAIIIVTGYGAFNLISGWNRRLSEEVENRTQQLNESQEKLRLSLDEKEVLLKEIHHRVKNNMALVSALLELQEKTSSHTNGNDSSLKTARSRISSMALAHEALYQNESFSNLSMKKFIHRISSLTHKSFASTETDINIQFDLDDAKLEMSKSIPLGLLINEILINAYKHAFEGRKDGRIWLESKVDDSQINLSIRDNGIGLPKKAEKLQTNSLGMTLIRKFTQQLKADFDIQSEKGKGTTFNFIFNN